MIIFERRVDFFWNFTDEAVQKYIKEQAEESRIEDSNSTALSVELVVDD